jgi:hypothetical protein
MMLAVGDQGVILRTHGGSSTAMPSGTKQPLYGLRGTDASNIFVVGGGGTILHSADGGATWRKQPSPTSAALRGIWGNGRRTFAVGADSTLLQREPSPSVSA